MAAVRSLDDGRRRYERPPPGRSRRSAGIGKTRLLGEARALATAAGMRVLTARRRRARAGVRVRPRPAAVRADARDGVGAGARRAVRRRRRGCRRRCSAVSSPTRRPPMRRSRFSTACTGWRSTPRSGRRRCSYSTISTGEIARRCAGSPMSPDALKACRWSSPRRRDLPHRDSEAPLLDEVLTDPTALVLRPGVLGPESVAALARETFETVPEAEFCVACHQATGGNPLYLQALLAALVADGVTPTAGSTAPCRRRRATARCAGRRAASLPAFARCRSACARAVAILGQSADLELAATLAGLDRRDRDHGSRGPHARGAAAIGHRTRVHPSGSAGGRLRQARAGGARRRAPPRSRSADRGRRGARAGSVTPPTRSTHRRCAGRVSPANRRGVRVKPRRGQRGDGVSPACAGRASAR